MSGQRVTTLRMPEDLADKAETVARVDGITMSELVRLAVSEYVAQRCAEQEFQARLEKRIEADQKILERLQGLA